MNGFLFPSLIHSFISLYDASFAERRDPRFSTTAFQRISILSRLIATHFFFHFQDFCCNLPRWRIVKLKQRLFLCLILVVCI
ncbi:unnamed protein product [Lathyrus sativus]|nr:unnamed protein product [Lathyrus sativus]